jgi:hypothetical protein
VPVIPGAFQFELDIWICMHENLKGSRRMRLMFDHLAAALSAIAAETASNPQLPAETIPQSGPVR